MCRLPATVLSCTRQERGKTSSPFYGLLAHARQVHTQSAQIPGGRHRRDHAEQVHSLVHVVLDKARRSSLGFIAKNAPPSWMDEDEHTWMDQDEHTLFTWRAAQTLTDDMGG
jgi:hypothetical protein